MFSVGIGVAESQNITTLVSNLAESEASAGSAGVGNRTGTDFSQGFGTGGNAGGYLLTGVSVAIKQKLFSGSETATFKIYDSETNGTPRNELYTLTTPTLTAGSTAFFAAPSGATLDPNENYHVVFQGTGNVSIDLTLEITNSDTETGETGWTIENAYRFFEGLIGLGDSVKLGIHGVANNAATGDPTISGASTVGLTLTADTTAIMDADGLSNVSYSYQWIRVDADGTSNPTPITGATGSTYTLIDADGGKRVRVRVSFTDDISVPEERTSDAYPSAGTVTEVPTLVSNLAETTAPGRLQVGSRSGTTVTQGFSTGVRGGIMLSGVSVAISRVEFTGAETATFKIYNSEDDGTPKDEVYTLTTPTLAAGATVFFAAPSGAVLESGENYHVVFQGSGDSQADLALSLTESTAQTGETGWTIEGELRFNENLTTGLAVKMSIHGTEMRLTPLVSNLAETTHASKLQVGNASGTAGSQGFGTGSHTGGYLLTGVSVEIADNNFSGSETATFKIYDSESDGTPGNEVYTLTTPTLTEGSTVFFAAPSTANLDPNKSYHVVFQGTGNAGNDLRLEMTQSDVQTGETGWTIEDVIRIAESLHTNGLSVKIGIHGVENTEATGDPTISGDPRVGLTLTAGTTAIMDADGLSNVTYSYQWMRVDADGTSNLTPITGATTSSYTLTSAEAGKRVRIRVSFSDENSVPEERTSDAFPATRTVTEEPTLVSNQAEITDDTSVLPVGDTTGTELSQGFSTGSNDAGYLLTGVSVVINYNSLGSTETATFKIYDSEDDGTPKDEVYSLTTPTLREGARVLFTAPAGATLKPDTNYHVVFQGTANTSVDLRLPLTDSDAQTGEAGFTIENAFRDNESIDPGGTSVKLGIHGTVLSTLVSNLAETAHSTTRSSVGNGTGTLYAQGFGTGTHAMGYLLTGVSVEISEHTFTGAETATFKIYDSETDGTPKDEVYTLTTPATLAAGATAFFEAPLGAMLDPNENYHVVFQGTGDTSADLKLVLTTSDAQTGQTGWTIEDAYRFSESIEVTGLSVKMSIHGTGDMEPPTLHGTTLPVLAADGKTLTITFNEAMKTSSVPANSAFTVKATPMGGSEGTVALATSNGVTVTGSTAVLKLDPGIAHNDGSVKVSYTKPVSGAVLEDSAGNDLANFPDTAVTNNSTIPRVSISTTDTDWTPTLAHAYFDLTRSNTHSTDGLAVSYEVTGAYTGTGEGEIYSGDTTALIRPSYSGNASGAVTVTVVEGDGYLPALSPNNAATVDLKTPATGRYVTISHAVTSNSLSEGGSVTHTVNFVAHAGVAQPRDPISVIVSSRNGTAFSGDDFTPVSESISISAGDWSASGGGWTASKSVTIQTTQDTDYEGNETFTLLFQRSPTGTSKITWAENTDVATFTINDNDTLGVTGIRVTSTAANSYYTTGNTILFEVAFNGSVTVDTMGGTPRFGFELAGQTRYAEYTSGTDSHDLVFSYTVPADAGGDHDGISWQANKLELNNGTIKFTATEPAAQVAANLDHVAQSPLPAHKVDTTKPMLASATVSGTTMTLVFSEDLNTTAPALSAFSGKKTPNNSAETALTFTGTPSISGRTVTLTLASSSSVSASDGDVKVSYTKPSNNPIRDLRGNEADSFTDRAVGNSLAESVPPTLLAGTPPVLAADGKTLTITLNEAMLESSVPANSAFTVKATPAGSTEATVALATSNGVTVSGSTVVLKLDPGIAHNDTSVKVSYTKPGTPPVLEDLAGNDLASFPDTAVTNNSALPRVSIAAVHSDASTGIASPEFRFTRSLVTSSFLSVFTTTTQTDTYILSTPDEIAIDGDAASEVYLGHLAYGGNTSGDLTVTLAAGSGYLPALAPNNSATVSIKAPATGKPINVFFNDVQIAEGDSGSAAVDISLPPGLADPREDYTVTLELIDGDAEAGTDFEHDGANIQVVIAPADWQNAVGGGKTYRINQQVTTLEDTVVEANETITLELFVSGVDAEILGLPEIDTPGHRSTITILDDEDLVISSVAVTSSQTDGYYSAGDDITFTVTFNAPVTVDTTDGTPQLAFDIGGQTRMATAADTDEETEAAFTYTVLATDVDDDDGISWAANAITLSGGTIVIPAKESPVPRNANLDHVAQSPLSGHKVDTSKPTLLSATVNATTITLVFSEDLNTTAPAITSFSGKKTPSGSSETALTIAGVAATVSGRTVTLTLATASSVTSTDTLVKFSYTKPSNNPIKDLRGHEADAFSDRSVGNQLADRIPPTLHTMTTPVLAADGVTLTITLNEAMNSTSVPANSAFTVKATPAGGTEATVALATTNGVTVTGSTVVLKLDPGIAHNDTSVKVSYTKPGSDPVLEDVVGNDLASFTDQAVTNNSTIPRVSIRAVHDDASPGIAHAELEVTRSNTDAANALTVNVSFSQVETYLATTTQTIIIPAGSSSATAKFPSYYTGNTTGDLTATVAAGDGYALAIGTGNAATVRMKVPTSGKTLTIAPQQNSYSVTEGASFDATATFTTGSGVARPRDDVPAAFAYFSGTASFSLGDYSQTGVVAVTVSADDWTASSGTFTASASSSYMALDDTEYEGTEQFFVVMGQDALTGLAFFYPVCPGGTAEDNSRICQLPVALNDNDTLVVSSVEVTSTPANSYYTAGNDITFAVTFNGNVTVTGTPRLPFELAGVTRYATYTSGSDSKVLVFSYTVPTDSGADDDGISWAANALELNNGTIKFTSTEPAAQVAANLDHVAQSALPGHKVDTTKPTLTSATVNATTMTLVFSEDLNTTAPALSAFSGKKTPNNSTETALTFTGTPSISGTTVTLTLASASSVSRSDRDVKVTYTKPGSNPIKDLRGNEADAITDRSVGNLLGETVPPTLHGATVPVLAADGLTLTITLSEPLIETSVPANSAFTVKATPMGGSEETLALASSNGVTVSGSTVVLKLDKLMAHDATGVKVSYAKPGSPPVLEDLAGNDLASFTDQAVTNNSIIPRVSISAVFPDASTFIAHPVVRATRSTPAALNANSLYVNLTVTKADPEYVPHDEYSMTILNGEAASDQVWDFEYAGNVTGDLVYTLVPDPDNRYIVDPTSNTATIRIKAPASGFPVNAMFTNRFLTVDEGDAVEVSVIYEIPAGLADPRQKGPANFAVYGLTALEDEDFVDVTPAVALEPNGWVDKVGGGKTQTVTFQIQTIQDTDGEINEAFTVEPLLAGITFGQATGWPEEPEEPEDENDPNYEADLAFYEAYFDDVRNNERIAVINIIDNDALEGPDVEVISEPTDGYYYLGQQISIELSFPFDIVLSGDGLPSFGFELGGTTRQAVLDLHELQEPRVVFSYTVASGDTADNDGISWAANAVSLNGGILQAIDKDTYIPRNASLSHVAQSALSGHKVRISGAPPVPIAAVVDGTTLQVLFSDILDTSKVPAIGAFSGTKRVSGSDTNLAFTGTPSISGSTLTLTLTSATSVSSSDRNVKLTYTKPNTNPITRTSGEEAAGFTNLDVLNAKRDSTSPTELSRNAAVLAADGLTLTITFDEILDSSSTPDKDRFTVVATPLGGSRVELDLATSNGVTVTENRVVLKLASLIAHNDTNVMVSYSRPSSSRIKDVGGNAAGSFYDQLVRNNSAIPRVSISAMHTDWTPDLADADFVLTRSNTAGADLVVNYSVSGVYTASDTSTVRANQDTRTFTPHHSGNTAGQVTLTVVAGSGYLPAIAPNNAVEVALKVPASGNYVTFSQGQASYQVTEGGSVSILVNFVAHTGVAQPRDEIAVAFLTEEDSATINVDYDHVSQNVLVQPGDWTAHTTGYIASKRVTVNTKEDTEYEGVETFVAALSMTQGVNAKISPMTGSEDSLITIVDNDTLAVSSVEVSSTPVGDYYVVDEAITFDVTFNGNVTVDETNGTPQLAFDIDGQTRQATYTSGSDSEVLVFSYTVTSSDGDDHDGISWNANALDRNNGTIKFTTATVADRVDADLAHSAEAALPDHRVDTEKPTLEEANVIDTTLTLTYSEELNTTAPAASAFSVTVDSATAVSPSSVSIAGRVVTLTLNTAVMPGQTVTLTYTKPSNDAIKDLSGKEADGFTNESVITVPPVDVRVQFAQSSYSVNEGSTVNVTVQLDKDPDRTVIVPIVAAVQSGASAADYSVPASVTFNSGETQKTFTFTATEDPVDDEGEEVQLTFGTLPTAVNKGSRAQTTVRISDNDNPLTVQSIAVTSTASNGYYLSGGAIEFTVTFTGPVAVDTAGGTPQFRFEVAGQTRQASYASGTGTAALVFSYTVAAADGEDRDGISWSANTLSRNGGKMEYSVTEVAQREDAVLGHSRQLPLQGHKVDTIKPTLTAEPEVDDDIIFLYYSEDLNTTAPANSAFSVSISGGTTTNPTGVSITGGVVSLTLTSAIARDAAATASYTKPVASPIRDLAGNEADGFSPRSVVPASDIENLAAAPGDRQVTLTWDALSDSELTRYQYRYMSTADTTWNPDWTNVPGSSASTTSFTARGLTNGLEYTFEIRPVYTRSGQIEPGKEGDVKAAPRGALVAPRMLSAARGGTGQIILSWNDANDVTITGYQYRYRTPTDSNWRPDWTDIAGSGPTTTSHTLSGLEWEVLYTFQLRTVRGSMMGPGAEVQGKPPEDLTRPSVVRELRAVTEDDSEVHLYFRAPESEGDSPIRTFEYRYAEGSKVPMDTTWQEMPSHLVPHRFFFVRDLVAGQLYTFEVRAINENNKTGQAARVEATPCCVAGAVTVPPSAPSAPASISATSSEPYTELVEVNELPTRVAYVDVTVTWEPAADHGNAVVSYQFRMAEGTSVPSSVPWEVASNDTSDDDELSLEIERLKPGTTYAFEVRSVSSHGASADTVQTSITTPQFKTPSTTAFPHYTMSVSSTALEGGDITITVTRTNTGDGVSTALVEIRDSFDNTNEIIQIHSAEFSSDATSATVTYTIKDDGAALTNRTLTIRIGYVGRSEDNTYSVEKHIVNVQDTTP